MNINIPVSLELKLLIGIYTGNRVQQVQAGYNTCHEQNIPVLELKPLISTYTGNAVNE